LQQRLALEEAGVVSIMVWLEKVELVAVELVVEIDYQHHL
tara:strand:- start:1132 stop:1251 length:120 start_codon:yes stop_codon:yes gene_type:complete